VVPCSSKQQLSLIRLPFAEDIAIHGGTTMRITQAREIMEISRML